jgi:3-phenylpropionate/trans-cinnamate dioxygenase ferredoxin reductase subunit
MTTRYLIIGGGVAGLEAARIIRQQDPGGQITQVSAEPHLPYRRPPLTKEFLAGQIARDALALEPESFFREQRIQFLAGTSVTQLDPTTRTARLSDDRVIPFDKALLATGGTPVRLPLPGADLPGVHYLRTVDDAAAIASGLMQGASAVLIGAGFIGLELAATMRQRGLRVAVIEPQIHIWPRFLPHRVAAWFQGYGARRGLGFCLGEWVAEIRGTGRAEAVVTRRGHVLPADLVCIGAGIRPNTQLAEAAGLAVDNGIRVNEQLQTSHPDIYAAGDSVNFPDPIFRRRRRVEHWGHAEYTGQLAGLNMTGGLSSYELLTYVWTDFFDLHIEFAGDESEYDRFIVRGGLARPEFTVLYLLENRLRAYLSVNTGPGEFAAWRKLITTGHDLSGADAQLEDAWFDLRKLR